MSAQALVSGLLAAAGVAFAALAVVSERRMQRHRLPGISYLAVTLRRDGGWRRTDLFTAEGLRHQRRASTFGIAAAGSWLLAVAAWVALAT
jgi:hypothetical protein